MPFSDETKDRVNAAFGVAKVSLAFHTILLAGITILSVGWIPLVIYIGYRNSSPQPSLIKLITPLA
nr:uncharacterized protein CI109_001042 [Kwoniella shandongensis]KAA5530242.1 hypothetical protein CI109_001042 [Kwoniella shandongensis]